MLAPRVVLVHRKTELTQLLERHGTRRAARFFLKARGRDLEEVEAVHGVVGEAIQTAAEAVPREWRVARVARADLDRFLFASDDVIVTVGQDGLVANVAKYARGQVVIGTNPGLDDGVLAPHAPAQLARLLGLYSVKDLALEERTLVRARSGSGLELYALNEIFVGHCSHQSARYTLDVGAERERQSSSGIVFSTGTGASAWARSICRARAGAPDLPSPVCRRLAFFVREAWPSSVSGCTLTDGTLDEERVALVTSEMNEGGVVFGDGVEHDFLPMGYGETVTVDIAPERLRLAR